MRWHQAACQPEMPEPVTSYRPLFSTLVALNLVAGATVLHASPAAAAKRHPQKATVQTETQRDPAMLRVDPATRVEQRCNARAMGVVGREQQGMRPDELVAYAFADTQQKDGAISAPGAAIRSAGRWYHLSYRCHTGADGMDVTDFTYVLGAEVPKQDWSEHSLVP